MTDRLVEAQWWGDPHESEFVRSHRPSLHPEDALLRRLRALSYLKKRGYTAEELRDLREDGERLAEFQRLSRRCRDEGRRWRQVSPNQEY
jgi:hypothetical protein